MKETNLAGTNNFLRESMLETKDVSVGYRWRRLIKSIIRIIRYLTNLKFKRGSNDQALRKFLT